MEKEFLKWYKKSQRGFHSGQLDEQQIAYAAWLEGRRSKVDDIPQSKEELLDCIQNLMAVVDTPIGRRKVVGDFPDTVRKFSRTILESNGKGLGN